MNLGKQSAAAVAEPRRQLIDKQNALLTFPFQRKQLEQ